jgi:uncharacterized protein YkwD
MDVIMGHGTDPRKLLYFVNRARDEAGLRPLAWSERLAVAAQAHAADMDARNFYAHVSPEGRTATDRGRAVGYSSGVGENIACAAYLVITVHDVWMRSPGHRANILHPDYKVIGCAKVGLYWVENFGCVVM